MLAAVTLFASCSQEEIVSKTDGESLVSFTVTTPELGSRAASEEGTAPVIGTGAAATDLYFVVYDETLGEQVETISSKTPYANFENKTATIQLPLLNGHKYSLIFWAENEAGAYAINWDKKSINLKDAAKLVSNDENYDAFYAYVPPFTVTGTKSSTIELKRPFAQLNIGTTATDLAGVKTYYNAQFAKSSIVVTAPTAMDLTTGNVSGEEELTYAAAAFISKGTDEEAANNLKQTYAYLSMNYLLVSGDKSLMDVDFSITDGTKTISKTFENIPVQRNYKTNIYGDLFTSINGWNVTLEDGFDGGYNPAEQLAAAFEKGGEVSLHTDVELTESLILPAGKTVTLNLNGRNIINKSTIGEFGKDEAIVAYGNLTIEGEGTVQSNSMAVWARGDKNAVITIKGGTFKGLKDGLAEGGRGVVYASSGNTINIEGGTFVALTADKTSFADKANGVFAALNIADNNGTINVRGGSFYKFNPAVPGTEPAKWNEAHPNGFVADGYAVKVNGDYYEIVKATEIFNGESDVTLYSNVVADATMNVASVDGQGNTVSVNTSNLSSMYTSGTLRFIQTSGDATIKNMTIDGNNASYKFDGDKSKEGLENYGIRGIFLTNAGNVTIDNVTIKNVLYPINTGDMSSAAANAKLSVSNSTLAGWSSFDGFASAKFEKCEFEVSAFNVGESIYNQGIAPYVTTVFENCDFAKGYYFDMSKFGAEATLTFKNCTVDGVKLTAAMFEKVTDSVNPVASKLPSNKTLWFEESTNCKIDDVIIQ